MRWAATCSLASMPGCATSMTTSPRPTPATTPSGPPVPRPNETLLSGNSPVPSAAAGDPSGWATTPKSPENRNHPHPARPAPPRQPPPGPGLPPAGSRPHRDDLQLSTRPAPHLGTMRPTRKLAAQRNRNSADIHVHIQAAFWPRDPSRRPAHKSISGSARAPKRQSAPRRHSNPPACTRQIIGRVPEVERPSSRYVIDPCLEQRAHCRRSARQFEPAGVTSVPRRKVVLPRRERVGRSPVSSPR